MLMRGKVQAAAGIATAGALGLGAGVLAAAREISGPLRPPLPYSFTPFEVGVDAWSDVELTAADGTRIAGWWLDRPGSERVVIVCHGHRSSKADMLGIGPGLWREGNSVLLIDFRGNGESDDGPQSLAHYEQADLVAAIDHAAQRRPDAEIDVVGFSMGAAVAILVAARDERVAKVVADSSFADMRGVIGAAAAHRHLPAVPLLPLVDRATRWRYGYAFSDVVPVDVVGQVPPRPLLLIHSEQDTWIPVEHARRLAAAAPGAELWLVSGIDHCGAYFLDRSAYITRVAQFLAR